MKTYKIIYYNRDKSKIKYIIQISKAKIKCGALVSFNVDGTKFSQSSYRNGLFNGIHINYSLYSAKTGVKNFIFVNCKKDDFYGIRIKFKK